MAQLLTAWEKQVQDYEQQSGKISDAIKLGVVLHHLPGSAPELASVRHVRTDGSTTWSGPTPMDLSTLAKDAACHVCGKGHFAKDCWHQSGNRGSGKGQKGKKGKKSQGKGTKPKDGDAKKKGACHNCGEVGDFARECPKKKKASNASSSGGSGVHCLTYTDDQSHWIMMLAEVGQS